MEDSLFFEDKEYISSKRAASMTKYTKDYIGQLCRGDKLDAKLVGRNWYVRLDSLEQYLREFANKKKNNLSGTISEANNNAIKDSNTSVESPFFVSHFKTRFQNTALIGHSLLKNEESKREQENLLTHMDVVYDESSPIFFDDNGPLYPLPSKSAHEDVAITKRKIVTMPRRNNGTNSRPSISGVVPVPTKTVRPFSVDQQRQVYSNRKNSSETYLHKNLPRSLTRTSRSIRSRKATYGAVLIGLGLVLLSAATLLFFQDTRTTTYTAGVGAVTF